MESLFSCKCVQKGNQLFMSRDDLVRWLKKYSKVASSEIQRKTLEMIMKVLASADPKDKEG